MKPSCTNVTKGYENNMRVPRFKKINVEPTPKSNFLATKTQRHKETLSLRFWISFLCESWCLSVLVAFPYFTTFRRGLNV